MTTPTPDQGALERAREIFRLMTSPSNPNDHITALAAALTAAASEARAAAIEECAKWHDAEAERICKLANEPRNTCNQTAMYSAADDHENCAIFIRALATPAQSPSPQTKEPE